MRRATRRRTTRRGLVAAALAAASLGGCLRVPDHVRAEFRPPDGSRPNNYGRGRLDPDGVWRVHPDRPSVAWREPPGADAGFFTPGERSGTEDSGP